MPLQNQTQNITYNLAVDTATSFSQRLIGLMFKKSYPNKILWIHKCKSVHTCFMKFPIDVVFVNKNLKIIHIQKNIKPWRFSPYLLKASSVLEYEAGVLKNQISVGDQLHVSS